MNINHGTFTRVLGRCAICGEVRDCIQFQPGFRICGEGLATALGNLTGWAMVNMYRTMRAQSDLREPDPRGIEDITPHRRKRK